MTQPGEGSTVRRGWALAAILVVALLLRIPGFQESLWFDEYFTSAAMIGKLSVLLKTMYSDIHPPAYFVFMYGWVNVFGDSEIALRVPPLLFGLGTLWLTYRLGEQLLGQTAGLVAMLFLALSPVHIWYSQEGRPNSAVTFLGLAAVTTFVRLWRGDTSRMRWVAYFAAVSCMVFVDYYMANFALVMGGLALLRRPQRRWAIAVCNGVPLALMAGYVGFKMYTHEFVTGKYYLRPFDLAEAWSLFFNWFLCGNVFTPLQVPASASLVLLRTVFQVFAVALFVLGIKRALGARDGWHLLACLAVMPVFLLVLPYLGKPQTYIERSVLPAMPFFALVLGGGVAALAARCRACQAGKTVGVLVAFQVAALAAYFAQAGEWTVYKPNPDWRAAARYLGRELDAGAAGRVIYTQYPSPELLNYYDVRINEAARFEVNQERLRTLLAKTESIFGKGGIAHGFVVGLVEEFEADKRRARDKMQLTIHQLHERDPLALPRSQRGDGTFYVVRQGPRRFSDPDVEPLLRSDELELIETSELQWLTVHKFRYVVR